MKPNTLQSMMKIALVASLISALGYVSIPLPISPVPITGQTLAILLAGFLLTPPQAGGAVGLWLAMGTIGLPVFSGGRAGFGTLIGPSGGYFIGFLVCALFIAYFKGKKFNLIRYSLVGLVGSFLIIYSFGVAGLMVIAQLSFDKALAGGVLPFLIGDFLKLIIAISLTAQLKRSAPKLFQN
jgi:biotin transport system substrate-specific component